MQRRICKRLGCFLIMCCILIGNISTVTAAEPFEVIGDVKPSDTAYSMVLSSSSGTFLRNKKEVELTVGKKYYMVYTVDEVTKSNMTQNGVLVSQDGNADWPYVMGTMKYNFVEDTPILFEEGATYFYRMEMTEDGLSYVVAKMGKNDSQWIELPITEGTEFVDCKYFGLWIAGTITARLSSVLCYDEKGNDLGITTHSQAGGSSVYNPSLLKEQEVGQYYEFTLADEYCLAISNARPTESDTVYFSYRVENVKKNKATQAGVAYSTAPTEQYPHAYGLLNYTFCDPNEGSPLFVEGAKYLIYAKNEGDTITTLVKRTINGVDEIFALPIYAGEIMKDSQFFSIWTGEGVEYSISADIKDFRCYDKNGNNLAVQTNKDDIEIKKFGDIEDYSFCEAIYWCEENNTTLILDDERNMGIKAEDADAKTSWYKYSVNGTKLTMTKGKQKIVYDYYYSHMLDTSGHKYIRLNETKVTFVTGIKDHESNQTLTITAQDGYKVKKPADPQVEGYTFKEWCLADGSSFNFDKYVIDSVTLYARYEDGDGHTYLAVDNEVIIDETDSVMGTVITCAVIAISTVIVIIIIIMKTRKVRKNEYKKEKKSRI